MKTAKQKKADVPIQTSHPKIDKRSIEKLIRDLVSSIIDEFGTTLVSAQRAKQISTSERDLSVIVNFARTIADSAAGAGALRIATKIVP